MALAALGTARLPPFPAQARSLTTLQDSINATDRLLARPPRGLCRGASTLWISPRAGHQLHGCLVTTVAGLPPASRIQLPRTHPRTLFRHHSRTTSSRATRQRNRAFTGTHAPPVPGNSTHETDESAVTTLVALRKRARRRVRRSAAAKAIMRPVPGRRDRRDSDVAEVLVTMNLGEEGKAIAEPPSREAGRPWRRGDQVPPINDRACAGPITRS